MSHTPTPGSTPAESGTPRWFHQLARPFEDAQLLGTLTLMTLILLQLYGSRQWYIAVPSSAICVAGMIWVQLRRHDETWLVLALILGIGVAENWYRMDNHKYLAVYWCIALFAALQCRDALSVLRCNGRLLVGLSMTLAMFWKLYTDDFVNGSFFYFELLFDDRFTRVSDLSGIVSEEMQAANRAAIRGLRSGHGLEEVFWLKHNDGIFVLAQALTWWTLAIEAWTAIAFLAPDRSFIGRWRDIPLLIFVGSTYILAPVFGFGYLLMIMGIAQCRRVRLRVAYALIFCVSQLYRVPWYELAIGLAE